MGSVRSVTEKEFQDLINTVDTIVKNVSNIAREVLLPIIISVTVFGLFLSTLTTVSLIVIAVNSTRQTRRKY
jgi:hypothetical protein